MTLFRGVHEVRLFRPNGVAVGYFDNEAAALAAVEQETSPYKAAYFTLNPLKLPPGIPVNPATLQPSKNAAGASDIERRVGLLIDCDPPRPAKTNSTVEEKRCSEEEAEKAHEYLCGHGWPDPTVADSGNGWHLLYRIDLPNNDAPTALVSRFLSILKRTFPMVDAGNFDAPRLCKLYGTWARKGENTEARPWRLSSIGAEGSGTVVTEAQLRELAPSEDPAPQTSAAVTDADLTRLLGFLEHYGVAVRSEARAVPGGWQVEIECPWMAEHSDESRRDTVVSFIAGRGYGFNCKHSHCVQRSWPTFRAEMQRRHPDNKFSFVAESEPIGEITIGEQSAKPERVRPTYPIEVWDGTGVGEFAKLCAYDNNIPRKLYAEAFRCALGAVVGDRLSCPTVDGGLPRSYTVIVAPKGKGKRTAIRRAVRFFSQPWYGTRATSGLQIQGNTSGLLSGVRDFEWKPKGIGAWIAAASSVPGMARLTKDLEATVKSKPHVTWGTTMPRILSVHEEMKTFLSTLFIEGGVGSGMEGVVCQLWDDVSFHGTATGTRDAVYGEMMFSLLAGVTEQDWFDLLSRGDAVGGGLMSRLNIIGTEGQYENVSRMSPPDFTTLQETFLPHVMQLENAHAKIAPTEAADRIISEWTDNLPEGSERMNVHAWRSALLVAWLKHEDAISPKTAEDAVRLGQYQVDSHDFYRTTPADNAVAKVQGKIVRALDMKGAMDKRELQQRTNARRDGTELWNRALEGLVRDKAIGKGEDGTYYLAG